MARMRERLTDVNRSDPRAPTADTIFLLVTINNLDELMAAYDRSLASVVGDVLHRRALLFCGECAGIVRLAVDRFALVMRWGARFANLASLAESATAAIGGEPIRFVGATVLAAVSVRVLPPDMSRSDIFGKVASSNSAVGRPRDAAWSLQYRTDMEAAVASVDALREGCLSLAWQPICRADEPERVLYWERLLRVSGDGKPAQSAGSSILALERLGLIRRLDQWVVNRVISELRSAPDLCVGCNISARSAVLDHGWVSVIARLRESPDVASRLIVEVTETARLPRRAAVREFVDALRSVGCRIAVDDFGAGEGSRKALTSLRPDFIKIDATFLRRARNDRIGRSCLSKLVRTAAGLGGIVIVEGVETLPDAHLAQEVGAAWLQGYLFGEPSCAKPQRSCPDDAGRNKVPAVTDNHVAAEAGDRHGSELRSAAELGGISGRTAASRLMGLAQALFVGHLVTGQAQPVLDFLSVTLIGGAGGWGH